MASTFGVWEAFLDSELELVACGASAARSTRRKGVVLSNRPDNKNALYQQTIKKATRSTGSRSCPVSSLFEEAVRARPS